MCICTVGSLWGAWTSVMIIELIFVTTEQQPWYFGRMNREATETLLKEVN